ncbi:MAG: alpha/beta hydrolase [Acidimicrobiales bacterium]|nr:alpha/beta hydrolase [Acidimicrobiales bacterium]
MSISSLLRRLVPLAVIVGGGAAIARRIASRREPIAAVAADLRHPILYANFKVTHKNLGLLRRVPPPPEPAVAGVDISDRTETAATGADVSMRIFEPHGRPRPSGALFWIHGGGMVMGRPEQDDHLLSTIATDLGILVVAARYQLAPEHPYPTPLDDCRHGLEWMHGAASELGIDPNRIAVGGASAGGGLAAGLALRCRDKGGPRLAFQLLNYPMLDDRTVLRADHGDTGEFVWTPESNQFGWTCYLGGTPQHEDDRIYAAPARADDLAGLPPAWIGVGDLDLFHAEDVDYARRLEAAGVPCELVVEPGMYHGADTIRRTAPAMMAYRQSMIDALGRAMN